MADVPVELDERARVAELLGALAREQLAASRCWRPTASEPAWRASSRSSPASRASPAWSGACAPPSSAMRRRQPSSGRVGAVERSTARRSGPTTSTASRASSSTSATRIRRAPPPRRRSARSRAATRCSSRSGTPPSTACVFALCRPGHDDRARRGRVLRHRRDVRAVRAAGGSTSSSSTRPARRRRTPTSSGSSRPRTRC